MGENYYRRYPGDYRRDTAHLSLMQHGAYELLLDSYYATGRPLPADVDALVRICGAQGKAERAAVESVASEFFRVGVDGLRHNARADRELCERTSYKDAQAMRAHMRWHKQAHMPGACLPSPSPTPTTKKNTPPPPSGGAVGSRKRPPAIEYTEAFVRFWDFYPRKTGKIDAWKAWRSLHGSRPHVDDLLAAIAAQLGSEQWTRDGGQYVPNPATWLRQGRWDDKPGVVGSGGAGQTSQPVAPKCKSCGIGGGLHAADCEHAAPRRQMRHSNEPEDAGAVARDILQSLGAIETAAGAA